MISLTVRGAPEIIAKFKRLSAEMAGDTLMSAALVGGEVIKAEAKRHASGRPGPRVVTGNLRASIMTAEAGRSATRATVDIGPGQEAPYGKFLELGTFRAPAYPFLRPALMTGRAAAESAVGDSLKRMLERSV